MWMMMPMMWVIDKASLTGSNFSNKKNEKQILKGSDINRLISIKPKYNRLILIRLDGMWGCRAMAIEGTYFKIQNASVWWSWSLDYFTFIAYRYNEPPIPSHTRRF